MLLIKVNNIPTVLYVGKIKQWVSLTNRVKFSTQDEVFEFTESVMNGATPERNLKWLEVKLRNRCNLKCPICGVSTYSGQKTTTSQLNTPQKKKRTLHRTFKDSEQFLLYRTM